ncbi:aromatic compound dioxygenase [Jackrogersella minutella]|nr:aromatic compound dioxygenase [Jackrogersella minutella]
MAITKKEQLRDEENAGKQKYDPHFTDKVIAATGPKAHPRLKQIMPSLLRHLHDFAREVDLTVAEWTIGVELINEAGRKSTERDETGLLTDILGLESLVDEITSKLLLDAGNSSSSASTPSAILGPFYRADAPVLANGSSIVSAPRDSEWYKAAEPLLAHVSGRVTASASGKPVAGATVDVWLAGPNGLYEQQDAAQPDMNLRGRFRTDALGRYDLYCLRPTAYPIPLDGPVGRVLRSLDRHPYRPAHIHFMVAADGYRTLTTQIFDADGDYVRDDAVFAVKDELLVRFERREGDERARWELAYDFALCEV